MSIKCQRTYEVLTAQHITRLQEMVMTAADVFVAVITPFPSPPLSLVKFSSVFSGNVINVVKADQRSYRYTHWLSNTEINK